MTNNDRPHDTPDVGDQNVERLIHHAYKPEVPDPAFVQRVREQLEATAWERARPRVEPAQVLTVRRRMAWVTAVAAGLAALALLHHATRPRPEVPREWRETFVERPSREIPAHLVGLHGLTARPRPPAPEVKPLTPGEVVTTGDGQRRRVPLADGTILYLNQNTSARLTAARQVTLARGEVFVEVAPRDEPFVVKTDRRAVTALGTKFNVRADDQGTGVLVTQGKVRVSGLDDALTAGQQLAAAADRPEPAPRASYALAWTRDLVTAAEAAVVPASRHSGGALVAVDPNGQEMRLSLRKYHIDVHVEDGFARTTIDQTYFNHESWRLEGTFYFPLPNDASLSRLAMYVEGNLMEGGMAERDYARNVFESIVTRQKDPALLEWVDGSTFKMRVFPLEGRQEKRIVLSYTQPIPAVYGKTTYRFPAGHNLDAVRDWSFHALVKNGSGNTWKCDIPGVTGKTEAKDLVIDGTARHLRMDKDVVLELHDDREPTREGARFSSALHEGTRYLMLRYRPALTGEAKRPRRDWVFLVETSADRDPLLARTQIDIVRSLLTNAEHDDTFRVLTAAARVQAFESEALPATPENVNAAVDFLEKSHLVGALDLGKAFAAVGPLVRGAANPVLVHVGTGIATLGERREDHLAKLAPNVPYVGVGVGKRWSRNLMKNLAERTGGAFASINPDEPVAWRAFELAATLNAPRLLDLKVVDNAERVKFLTWNSMLAQGEELCAVARVDKDAPGPESVTVSGRLDGQPYQRVLKVDQVADNAGYLPRTWAKLEIDRLLAENSAGNKNRIVELSKAMYVMTPFTSLLVLENEEMYRQFNVDRGRKDHWALYPCPQKIPVVYEPLGGPPAAASTNMPTKPAPEHILTTIVVRIPPRWVKPTNGRDPLSGVRALTAFHLLDGAYAIPDRNGILNLGKLVELERLRPLDLLTADVRSTETGSLLDGRGVDGRGWIPLGTSSAEVWEIDAVQGIPRSATPWSRSGGFGGGFGVRRGGGGLGGGGLGGGLGGSVLDSRFGNGAFTSDLDLLSVDALERSLAISEREVLLWDATRATAGRTSLGDGLFFQPDGRRLLTTSADRAALLWGGESRELLRQSEINWARSIRLDGLADLYGSDDFIRRDGELAELDLKQLIAFRESLPVRRKMTGELSKRRAVSSRPASDALVHLILNGDLFAGTTYQRPEFSGDDRVFTDLVAYAPGMNTSRTDIRAALEAEAALRETQPGKVDAEARKWIDKARGRGWQTVTLPGLTVTGDGAGRYAYERTLAFGLRERVVCDGTTLLHLYPDIGLGARRAASRFHRADFAALVPWLVPSADDLARGGDVESLGSRVIGLSPRGAAGRKDAEGKPVPYAQTRLHFAEDGRLTERSLVALPAGKTLLRETYDAQGAVTLLDANGKELSRHTLVTKPAEAPDLAPDTRELVVVPLPIRTHGVVRPDGTRVPLPTPLVGGYTTWPEDVAIGRFAAECFLGRSPEALQIFGERFRARGDNRLGFYTLLLAGGHNYTPRQNHVWLGRPVVQFDPTAGHADEPLAKFLLAHNERFRTKKPNAPVGDVGAPPTSFLGQLARFHDRYKSLLTVHNVTREGDNARAERERLLAYLRDGPSPLTRWVLFDGALRSHAVAEREFFDALKGVAEKFDPATAVGYAARYQYAWTLQNHNRRAEARQQFRALYDGARKATPVPPLDAGFINAFRAGPSLGASNDLVDDVASWARHDANRLAEEKQWAALLVLAWQYRQLGYGSLVDPFVARMQDVSSEPKSPSLTLLAAHYYSKSGQPAQAVKLVEQLLRDKDYADQAGLWRLGVALARQANQEVLPSLERATDLEYQQMPDVVNVEEIRRAYGELFAEYQRTARTVAAVTKTPPPEFVARILRAADRWRSLDTEPTAACQAAALPLTTLGARELAWDYLTTPLGLKPNESAPWLAMAQTLRAQNEVALADRAYAEAFDAEPTNAQILWDRAAYLRDHGHPEKAAGLFRRLAEGTWQPRFNPLKEEARRQLTR